MKDLSTLRARLRRAGLKPASDLQAPVRKSSAIPADWPGREIVTPIGTYFLAEFRYPAGARHGGRALSDFLESAGCRVPDLPAGTAPTEMVFMDTETTGLAGGAGTLAFLIGTGAYDAEGFVLRQYFLPDPSGEAALLEAALGEMESQKALVTFNGRVFDVPILQARAALRLRRFDALARQAHLDLLLHSRRIWSRRLESCALRSLEAELLGVRRSSDDVPGGLIPYLYREYLQTNDPAAMSGVLYHNAQDVLSLAVLAAEVAARYARAPAELEDPLDALAMAFVQRGIGRLDLAEEGFRTALQSGISGAERVRALDALAGLLKRGGRFEGALEWWRAWHELSPDDPLPCVELAKYYEWRARDLAAAQQWAEAAADASRRLRDPARRRALGRATSQRLKRLEKKQRPRSRKSAARPSRA
jgi:uncharacterized protein YprB with RNaseH-like and TPR domain